MSSLNWILFLHGQIMFGLALYYKHRAADR